MLHLKNLLFFILLIAGISAVGQSTDDDLKPISALLRTNPDTVITLLPRFLDHPGDSIRATAHLLMGNAWYFKSNYDSAMKYHSIAADLFLETKDDSNLGKAYNGLGLDHYFLSKYEKAFEYHTKALQVRERNNDPQVTSTYNNLGLVMVELGSHGEALRYYNKSLSAKIRFKQFTTLSTTLTNISGIFRAKGDLDSALHYEMKNLKHLDSIPDKRNQATCYNNLGLTFFAKGDYRQSEFYFFRAIRLEKSLQRGFELINVCKNLSLNYEKKGQLSLADKYLDSVFILVENPQDFRSVISVYLVQARLDSIRGHPGAAYVHLLDYIRTKEHFDEIERKNLVLDLEKKYQAEIKEQQITELQQANTIKDLAANSARQRQVFLVIGLILLAGSILVLFNRYQFKQRAAKVLDEKNEELQKLNAFKDHMFAVISHDLRNPVDAFSTIIESLHQNLQHASKEELKEFLESTLESAKDLKSLLNNLLEWSLVQIGKLPFSPKPVALIDTVQDSISHTESMALLKDVRIENHVGQEAAFADRSMLTIVLRNLLSNAIKFSETGSVIQLRSERQNGKVIVSVKDEGIGMKPDDVSKLFRQDVSARSIGSSTAKGAGIGLLLCKELIEKNEGKIYAQSELGRGSTFSFEIPAA
jgi:signal transduction histidine kinase